MKCTSCRDRDASYGDLCRECYEDKVRRECHTAWHKEMLSSREYEIRKCRTGPRRRYDSRWRWVIEC